MSPKIEFTRISNDVNGNARFVCHYLNLVSAKDFEVGTKNMSADETIQYIHGMGRTEYGYSLALKRSRQFGGKKFNNKQYKGGIVFQRFAGSLEEMSAKIQMAVNNTSNINTELKQAFEELASIVGMPTSAEEAADLNVSHYLTIVKEGSSYWLRRVERKKNESSNYCEYGWQELDEEKLLIRIRGIIAGLRFANF